MSRPRISEGSTLCEGRNIEVVSAGDLDAQFVQAVFRRDEVSRQIRIVQTLSICGSPVLCSHCFPIPDSSFEMLKGAATSTSVHLRSNSVDLAIEGGGIILVCA